MSLLQSPIATLDQIEWYLENRLLEKFPGAFLLSAGNLCRQIVEQILFILAFYCGLPRQKYMKPNYQLKMAHEVFSALCEGSPGSKKTYLAVARQKGSRIRKFARFPRSLNKWRKEFNEPSHFKNQAANSNVRESHIRDFVKKVRPLFDESAAYLIIAAVNELKSGGKIKANLSADAANVPGVETKIVVTPRDLILKDGRLALRAIPNVPIQVVPDDREVPYRWSSRIVLVQHSKGLSIRSQLVAEDGQPINLTNMATVLASLGRTPTGRKRVEHRLRKLGVRVAKNANASEASNLSVSGRLFHAFDPKEQNREMVVGFRSDSTGERFEETITLNADQWKEFDALTSNEERQMYLRNLPQAKEAFGRAARRAAASQQARNSNSSDHS